MKCMRYFPTKLTALDIHKCNCFWVPSYDLFTSARKAMSPAPTATSVHRLRNTWLSLLFQLVNNIMATTRPITTFFQPVKSSEIENETVNGVEPEAEATEFENGEHCFMLLFHFLRNVTDCGLDKMHVSLSKHLCVCCFSWAFWFWCRSLSGRSSFKWCYGR